MKYIKSFFNKKKKFFDEIENLIKYISPDSKVVKNKHVNNRLEITNIRIIPKLEKDESVLDKPPFKFIRFYEKNEGKILICIFKENSLYNNLGKYLVEKIKLVDNEFRKEYYDAIEYFVLDIPKLVNSLSIEDFEFYNNTNKYNL